MLTDKEQQELEESLKKLSPAQYWLDRSRPEALGGDRPEQSEPR
jgi:hypothetical protein